MAGTVKTPDFRGKTNYSENLRDEVCKGMRQKASKAFTEPPADRVSK